MLAELTRGDGPHQNPTGTYIIPMIASSYTLAACVMSVIVSFIGMPLGRRNCILLGDILVVIGGALQASSWSVPQIIIARVLCVSSLVLDGGDYGQKHVSDLS